jgi:hypothetical protein
LFACEYAKPLFHLLVGALALSISLRVVCHTHILLDIECFAEHRDEFGAEVGVSVQDDLCRESIMWYNGLCIEFCCFFGSDCFIAWDEK